MEFLRSFLRRHLAGKPVVASPNVGCFLRLANDYKKNFRNIKDFAINSPNSSINLTDKYYILELLHSLVMSTLLSIRACYIKR